MLGGPQIKAKMDPKKVFNKFLVKYYPLEMVIDLQKALVESRIILESTGNE